MSSFIPSLISFIVFNDSSGRSVMWATTFTLLSLSFLCNKYSVGPPFPSPRSSPSVKKKGSFTNRVGGHWKPPMAWVLSGLSRFSMWRKLTSCWMQWSLFRYSRSVTSFSISSVSKTETQEYFFAMGFSLQNDDFVLYIRFNCWNHSCAETEDHRNEDTNTLGSCCMVLCRRVFDLKICNWVLESTLVVVMFAKRLPFRGSFICETGATLYPIFSFLFHSFSHSYELSEHFFCAKSCHK